jgi:two-component system capsular synthesis response regulator RcsB
VRILVADDHPIICIALGELLKSAFGQAETRIDVASNSDEVVRMLEAASYELLVVDLQMPGQFKSVFLLEALLTRWPQLLITVYTGVTHPSLALAAMDLGVRAYVLKASGPSTAIEAMRLVLEGQRFVDPAVDVEAARAHPWHQLTPGERQVLLAIARGKNLQAIAIDSGRSYKTVTAHKYNALSKLGLRSNAEMGPYLTAHGLDYLLGDSQT